MDSFACRILQAQISDSTRDPCMSDDVIDSYRLAGVSLYECMNLVDKVCYRWNRAR